MRITEIDVSLVTDGRHEDETLPPTRRDPRWSKAREALIVIAAVAAEDSDYARQQNGVGFSKSDSSKGHSFAKLSVIAALKNDAIYAEVVKMAARCRR
jgi:hypothetical protein